jgi:peptidyl-prolyl cis-trans isomerase SurA
MLERSRKERLQRMILDTLGKLGQMPTVSVSERDIMTAFDSLKKNAEPRGPVVTFRQIVIKPVPSDSAENRAKTLADSLLAAIKAGASFDSLAMKFSDDSSNAKEGGDLGWQSRGRFVREFDQVVFSLPIGQVSNVVKTQFGYHIIKVDRIRPGEVRSRHILIVPRMDARDVARAKLKAEKIAEALKAGANYDSLADTNHDPGERPILHSRKVSIPLAELPEEYANALRNTKTDSVTPVFDVVMPDGSPTKAAVAQVLERNETGEYTLAEVRERLRSQLSQAGSWRRLIDNLRKQTYVSVRLDSVLRAGKTSQ